jgi:predicted transcriptional regulator
VSKEKERRRDQLSITASILEHLKGKRLKPTHVMYQANLSYTQLQKYLPLMLHNGLIAQSNSHGKEDYGITEEGLEYLQIYHELIKKVNNNTAKRNNQLDP